MENNKTLATVGSREITQRDMDFFMKSINPQTAAQFQSPEGQKQLLNELINQEVFYLDAMDKGMDKKDDFQKEVERMKENLLKQFAINELLANLEVTEEEMKEFYETNKAQFVSPKSVQASHILVKELEEAQKAMKEIEDGASFEEVAKKYSTCPSKERGGDLGFFGKGQMVPEFEEAAFAMELNTISEPVKSQFGYHIIKVTDEKEEGTKSLEEVKPQIQQQLLAQKQQKAYFDKAEELKDQYKVEVK